MEGFCGLLFDPRNRTFYGPHSVAMKARQRCRIRNAGVEASHGASSFLMGRKKQGCHLTIRLFYLKIACCDLVKYFQI